MSYFKDYQGKYESPTQNQGSQRRTQRFNSETPTVRVHSASQLKTAKKKESKEDANYHRS